MIKQTVGDVSNEDRQEPHNKIIFMVYVLTISEYYSQLFLLDSSFSGGGIHSQVIDGNASRRQMEEVR